MRMWRGYPDALQHYIRMMDHVWNRRGYGTRMKLMPIGPSVIELPWWVDDNRVYASHRHTLAFKKPEHYAKEFARFPEFSPAVTAPEWGYFWPDKEHPDGGRWTGNKAPSWYAKSSEVLA
jgi:hypothetical protein